MKFPVKNLFETKFIKVFDILYAPGKHYYDATRRSEEQLVANHSDEEFLSMMPDAVSLCVILKTKDEEPRLLLSEEYRYPVGRFLLSPPAGLIDPEDREKPVKEALYETAKRELFEETGLIFSENDEIVSVSDCLFSSPGMTDESNAVVKMTLFDPDLSKLSQEHAVGSELFRGFRLLTKKEAKKILKAGKDFNGFYFSVYTWMVLKIFTDSK